MKYPIFFTETGKLIEPQTITINKYGFVVLGTVQLEEHFKEMEYIFSEEELKLAGNYLYNHNKKVCKDYHFSTSDSIFTFGYGPIYS